MKSPKKLLRFALHPTLERDSHHVTWLSLCEVRLIDDARWTWLILIPQRPDIKEMFELPPLDQVMMTFESNLVASALQKLEDCDKLNMAAIGNKVQQLHYHIIARMVNDAAWPEPVWGHGTAQPYGDKDLSVTLARLKQAIQKA